MNILPSVSPLHTVAFKFSTIYTTLHKDLTTQSSSPSALTRGKRFCLVSRVIDDRDIYTKI